MVCIAERSTLLWHDDGMEESIIHAVFALNESLFQIHKVTTYIGLHIGIVGAE